MRKIAASLLLLTLAVAPAAFAVQEAPQEEQQDHQQVEGTLDGVDLEAQVVVIADSYGSEVELAVTEETTITGPDGSVSLDDLAQQQGADVRVTYADDGMTLQALSIELLA